SGGTRVYRARATSWRADFAGVSTATAAPAADGRPSASALGRDLPRGRVRWDGVQAEAGEHLLEDRRGEAPDEGILRQVEGGALAVAAELAVMAPGRVGERAGPGQRRPDQALDLEGAALTERGDGWRPAEDGGDLLVPPRHGDRGEGAEHGDVRRVQARLLLRLAQGGVDVVAVAGIASSTGQGELAGLGAQAVAALLEHEARILETCPGDVDEHGAAPHGPLADIGRHRAGAALDEHLAAAGPLGERAQEVGCGRAHATPMRGQTSASTHSPHFGARAVQTRRPWRMRRRLRTVRFASGPWAPSAASWAMRSSSTVRGLLAAVQPRRRVRRPTCVSTASREWPNQAPRTTCAVLRPTPGRASSAAWSSGTSPPGSTISPWASPRRRRARVAPIPSGRTTSVTSASSAPARAAASGQRENSSGVSELTRTSVVWAESTVATSISKASRWSSSVRAPGCSAASSAATRAASAGAAALSSSRSERTDLAILPPPSRAHVRTHRAWHDSVHTSCDSHHRS